MDDFAGFGAPSNPALSQTVPSQPVQPMMNLMPQNQSLISQNQPIMSTSTNQPMMTQGQQPMMFPNQGMMMAPQSQGMMQQGMAPQAAQSAPKQSQPQVQSKVSYYYSD